MRPTLAQATILAALLAGSCNRASDDADGADGGDVVQEPDRCQGVCTPKSLVIALDGTKPDAFRLADTPHFDSIRLGTWADDYKGAGTWLAQVIPDGDSYSGPNHGAIMTGATVTQLGVIANDAFIMVNGRYDEFPHYLTRLETHDPSLNTGYLFTWSSDIFIETTADYKRQGQEALNTERIIDMLAGQHEDTTAEADGSVWTAGMDPDALFLFYDFTDGAGHSYTFSVDAPEYISALEQADGYVGTILDAIKARPSFADENWQIIVTADHGGYRTSHSGRTAPMAAIPFFISSKDVIDGELPHGTGNRDVAPSVMDHFGLAPDERLTGAARGRDVLPEPSGDLREGLVAVFPFDGDTSEGTGAGLPDGTVEGTAALEAADGKIGGHLSVSADGDHVVLPALTGLDWGDDDDFSFAFWMRADGAQSGDPVIMGNKDWSSGANPGWAVLGNEGGDNSLGTNFASSTEDRRDIEDIDYTGEEGWMLVVQTYDADGLGVVYVGYEDGRLQWMAQPVDGVGALDSGLPIRVGQDGTGAYPFQFRGDLDELAFWNRSLRLTEVEALLAGGQGTDL